MQVDEEIAAESLAVVGEAAPAEESHGIEGVLGGAVDECVPVDGLRAGVGRNGIDPGAAGRIAIPVSIDGSDFAELAGIVNLLGFGVEDRTDALAADCDHALVLVRGFDHGESVFDGVRHGLLAINIFAGGDSVFEDVAMLVVHGGDEDRVDVFAIENAAIVAHGFDVGILHRFAGGGVAAVVKIADADALDAGNVERSLEVFASANAGADGSEADSVAGRNAARGSIKLMRLQDVFGDGCSSDRAGTELNKSTTGQGILRHFPPSQLQQVIFRTGEFARAEMMRRNYCTREGELVKRFSKEEPHDGLNAGY